MQLGYVIIYVKDVQETIKFYEKAFGLKTRFIHDSKTYAEMETGKTALAFVSEEMMKNSFSFKENRISQAPAGIEISLVTQNVEEKYNIAIKAGAESVAKPLKKPWGQIVAYVKDNNGVLVEICSPMES